MSWTIVHQVWEFLRRNSQHLRCRLHRSVVAFGVGIGIGIDFDSDSDTDPDWISLRQLDLAAVATNYLHVLPPNVRIGDFVGPGDLLGMFIFEVKLRDLVIACNGVRT